jgi:hypothetical protein
MIRQISFAIVAIGLVIFIGTSIAPAALAFFPGGNTFQSIKQANNCFDANNPCFKYYGLYPMLPTPPTHKAQTLSKV